MSGPSFEELVKLHYDELSSGKQRVAKFMLNSLEEASYSTTVQLQKKIGVSETTIIRFAYALGFNGFSQMQKAIQREILSGNSQGDDEESGDVDGDKKVYADIIKKDIAILQETIKQLQVEDLEKATEFIGNAEKVLVVGHHTAYAAAYWFAATLGLMLPSIQLVDQKNAYQELLRVTDKTVIVAISFPRYRKDTYTITSKAKTGGCKVIAITDSELAPISRLADVSLLTKTNRDESGYNGISPVISLLNVLIVGVRQKKQKEISKRLLKLESFYEQDDSLFE
ncbi:DNA-binding MurR/RpiR family transcriptional regulator [Kroppenstedtia sanguinis]|mgnify:CR=1 FL=1|uniref:MurR/RpiR family transcriptional regulator n=1 Tax=Kroppenstedtia sanguinis TaxID=1380684 RepID=A0ABW4C7M6_9BACL